MEVAIIGGGIGGLATALYLHQRKIACRVYEAEPGFSELGVGINLLPHAIRALGEIGLVEALAKVAVEPHWLCFYNRHGQLIHRCVARQTRRGPGRCPGDGIGEGRTKGCAHGSVTHSGQRLGHGR